MWAADPTIELQNACRSDDVFEIVIISRSLPAICVNLYVSHTKNCCLSQSIYTHTLLSIRNLLFNNQLNSREGEVHEQIDTFVIHFNILLIFFRSLGLPQHFQTIIYHARETTGYGTMQFLKKTYHHAHTSLNVAEKNNRRQWRLKCFLSMLLITIFNAYNLNWFHRTLNSAHAFRMNEIEIFGFFLGHRLLLNNHFLSFSMLSDTAILIDLSNVVADISFPAQQQ